jgi:hypothetical protein
VPPLPTTVKPFLPPVTGESGDAPGPADAPPLDAARRDQ